VVGGAGSGGVKPLPLLLADIVLLFCRRLLRPACMEAGLHHKYSRKHVAPSSPEGRISVNMRAHPLQADYAAV
jgi:hypothetical protein